MNVSDRLYGTFTIRSPILLEILHSKSLARLKGIAQYGIPDEYYHLKNYTRFEHSVGVMLLLKHLHAKEEEQIAGLIHDISHTAFSHTIDWVIGEGKTENFQDEQHAKYLKQSDISIILKRYGYELERFVDYHSYTLLEKELPDLCADRIDYALREMSPAVVQAIVPYLIVYNDSIVCANQATAALFAREFLKLQTQHWGGFEAASRYRLFADVLRLALEKNLIQLTDFWQNDAYIIHKIKASGDEKVLSRLDRLTIKSLLRVKKSGRRVIKKFRAVDPLYLDDGCLYRLSEEDDVFKQALQEAKKQNQAGIEVPLA